MVQYEGYTLDQLEAAAGGGAKRRWKRTRRKFSRMKDDPWSALAGALTGGLLGGMAMGGAGSLAGAAMGASSKTEGGGQTEAPPTMDTETTLLGNSVDGGSGGGTFNEEEEKEKRAKVNKAKLGTRGLRIPLASTQSTTTNTAATTGVQI